MTAASFKLFQSDSLQTVFLSTNSITPLVQPNYCHFNSRQTLLPALLERPMPSTIQAIKKDNSALGKINLHDWMFYGKIHPVNYAWSLKDDQTHKQMHISKLCS